MKDTMQSLGLLLIILTIGVILSRIIFPVPPCPPEGYVMWPQERVDSMQALADKPPVIEIKIDSIPYEKEVIRYVEVPVHSPVDDSTNFVQDTLKTDYFAIYLQDTLRSNRIVSRAYNYDLYVPKEITKTITITKPVPYPYPIEPDLGRFYGGVNAGQLISADINYRFKDNFLGLGVGYVGKESYFYVRYQKRLW